MELTQLQNQEKTLPNSLKHPAPIFFTNQKEILLFGGKIKFKIYSDSVIKLNLATKQFEKETFKLPFKTNPIVLF